MKLFATSLLVASAISFTSASTCQSPIVSNGQCIGMMERKSMLNKGKFKRVDCSSTSAMALEIDADGKLCSGVGKRKVCLARRYRNTKERTGFRMSKKIKGTKMAFVKFNYDAVINQLKVTAPNDQANKYPVFDKDVKISLSDSAEDVGCSNVVTAAPTTAAPTTAAPTTAAPTTAAPTTAAPTTAVPIESFIVTNTSRVTIQQTSNNELHLTTSGSAAVFIEKDFDYFTMRIVNYAMYNSVGLSIKQDWLFRGWAPTSYSNLGKLRNTIGNYSMKAGDWKKIYNYLGSRLTTTSLTSIDRPHNNGETIKVSQTDTVIEFSRDGVVYHTYTFQASDRKDLFPAVCLFAAGDEYIVNIH